jgi:chaperonin GroES
MKRSLMTKEETSLKSQKETQQTNQKPKYALEEKYKEQTEKLPKPTGWRIIVLPFKMNDKTEGGVLITESALERQQVASQCGLVLAMGPQCYRDKERYPDGPWCKVNDWVVFARYAGSRINIEGGEIRLLNEDEILATVKDPKDILHAF